MFRQHGFHYVEVVIATLLLTMAIAPAMDALTTSLQSSTVPSARLAAQYAVTAKMEEVLNQSVNSLDSAATAAGSRTTPTSYSDASGTDNRRLVYLSRFDGDNADGDNDGFTGVDAGLIWVRVELENGGLALESLAGAD